MTDCDVLICGFGPVAQLLALMVADLRVLVAPALGIEDAAMPGGAERVRHQAS